MTREWKAGDVGVNVAHGYRGIFVAEYCRAHDRTGCWHNESGFTDDASDIRRPLVVIDPEDREQVERLTAAMRANGWTGIDDEAPDDMQTVLRSLIADPKPEEPTGLGAVVEVRYDGKQGKAVFVGGGWVFRGGGLVDYSASWDDFNVLTVISKGVTA